MFGSRYFADRYFAPRYFPKHGLTPAPAEYVIQARGSYVRTVYAYGSGGFTGGDFDPDVFDPDVFDTLDAPTPVRATGSYVPVLVATGKVGD